MGALPVPRRRHRDQHPVEERHDLDADDLRAAGVRDAGPARASAGALAVARPRDRAGRGRRTPPRRAAAPPVREDAHAARRDPGGRARDVRRGRPAPAGHGRVALPPVRQHRPGAVGRADRFAGALAAPAAGPARLAGAVGRRRGVPAGADGLVARRDAPPLRRVGATGRRQRGAGALRRPAGRPRRRDAPAGGAARADRARRPLAGARGGGVLRTDAGARRRAHPEPARRAQGQPGVLPERSLRRRTRGADRG